MRPLVASQRSAAHFQHWIGGKLSRTIRGAEAGAAAAVALSFFVFDLVRLQPLGTPGALSGALMGPGREWDFTSFAGFIAGLSMAYRIATFTAVHFLTFAFVGILASVLFDWKNGAGLKPLLAVAGLCVAAFATTVLGAGSGPLAVVSIGIFAALLVVGYLRLASMPEPEDEPAA